MSERPIEEIIGWTLDPDAVASDHPERWWNDLTYRVHAEVDDLATWLDEHGPADWDVVRWSRRPRLWFPSSAEWEKVPTFDRLIGAYEWAVRKVAAS